MSQTMRAVVCLKYGEVPEIEKRCGDNGTNLNGVEYRLECKCGGKDQPFYKSMMMAIANWETVAFKI